MRLYHYIGPRGIVSRIRPENIRTAIRSPVDVRLWVGVTLQELSAGYVTVTFVVDCSRTLLIADRRSEHVACAGGQPVLSAGEMTFEFGKTVEVVGVTNQSTGYCPEPESWPAVAATLSHAGFVVPDGFTSSFEFRRCIRCGTVTLIKEAVFECAVCGCELPARYNVQELGPTH